MSIISRILDVIWEWWHKNEFTYIKVRRITPYREKKHELSR